MPPRSTKRQRASPLEATQTADPKHERFTSWARDRGVEIHGVSPQQLKGRGLGLVTTRAISEGDRILFVPEEAMFKPDFAALRRLKMERASPQAKLVMSAMLKFTQSNSSLVAWEATWPTKLDFEQCMPLYWDEALDSELPPSVQAPFQRQRADYARDWQMAESFVKQMNQDEAAFKYYWMIVNSRSFHWAPPKGGAGFMVMCPFIDYINHGPTGTGCNVMQRSDGYEVVAQRKYRKGEEILATYGAHSNDKLLVNYGFILPYSPSSPSPDDEIRTDAHILPMISEAVKQQLSDVGYLGPFALIPKKEPDDTISGWELCFKTQVAVRATRLTCNEWEYFASYGEDLSGDKSVEVFAALKRPFRSLVDEADRYANAADGERPHPMSEDAFQAARNTSKQRWKQIADSVRCFIDESES